MLGKSISLPTSLRFPSPPNQPFSPRPLPHFPSLSLPFSSFQHRSSPTPSKRRRRKILHQTSRRHLSTSSFTWFDLPFDWTSGHQYHEENRRLQLCDFGCWSQRGWDLESGEWEGKGEEELEESLG